MNLNFSDFFVIIGLFFIISEFKLLRNNIIYVIPLIILIIIIWNQNLWGTNFFNLNLWKMMFLSMITLSFFIIFELIEEKTFDVYCLLFLVFIGSFILIVSDNLLMIYLGLELQTFSIFILIAKNRISIKGSEAGLKYFMLGAISSGFYLLGLVILFLFGYNLELQDLLFFKNEDIVILAITLIICSFCFKLSLFPFHFWIPDIYEGSSWDIVSLIGILPKISVICVTIQILFNSNVLLLFCLLSISIGTLGALNQSKLKRLLAYSGISHMGFIVLGYLILNQDGYITGSLYLVIYMLSMISLFIIIINNNNINEYIIELGGLKFISKVLSITLILLILSIAGIPPLSGFINKWYLIWVIIENKFNISSFIIILFSAIGIGYYLRIVKTIYFQKRDSYMIWSSVLTKDDSKKGEFSNLVLGFTFFFTMFLIFNFSLFINIFNFLFYLYI